MDTRAFSQSATDETLMRSRCAMPLSFSAIKHSRSNGVDDAEHNFPVQAVGHGRDGQGRPWAKLVVPSTGSMIQQVSGRLRLPRSLQRGIQPRASGLQGALSGMPPQRYRFPLRDQCAPYGGYGVGMGMIGADDGAAFLDDGKGLQGQW